MRMMRMNIHYEPIPQLSGACSYGCAELINDIYFFSSLNGKRIIEQNEVQISPENITDAETYSSFGSTLAGMLGKQ